MLKGINQWCYPNGTPLKEVFKYSKEAGFDAVELNLNQIGDIGLTLETTKEEALEIKALASSYNLKLRSLSTALLWQTPLSSLDEEIQEQGIKTIKKMLELAYVMGMDTILVVPGVVTPDVPYDVCYKRSQAALRQVVPLAEKFNITIGIENVWNKFLLSPLEMKRFVDEIESTHLGVYFDIGNILQFGYPEQWIKILGKRICKVHVKDFKLQIGNGQGFTNLLSGDVPWKRVKEALDEIGYNDTLTAELQPYTLHARALAKETAEQLNLIIDGL